MLPLVFDDTSAKRGNKKNDDDNANNNANNNRNDKNDDENDDGFRINEVENLIAEVATIVILVESNQAAGMSLDLNKQSDHNKLYTTVKNLF